MQRALTLAVVIPSALILVVLAVANRQAVTLSIDPFSSQNANLYMELPLFIVISVSLAVGVIAGCTIGWWQQMGVRRDLHTKKREAEKLQRDLFDAQNQLASLRAPPTALAPWQNDV
jgi:uncharacterized integral membrane protein